jgi:hypothetical protein
VQKLNEYGHFCVCRRLFLHVTVNKLCVEMLLYRFGK